MIQLREVEVKETKITEHKECLGIVETSSITTSITIKAAVPIDPAKPLYLGQEV